MPCKIRKRTLSGLATVRFHHNNNDTEYVDRVQVRVLGVQLRVEHSKQWILTLCGQMCSRHHKHIKNRCANVILSHSDKCSFVPPLLFVRTRCNAIGEISCMKLMRICSKSQWFLVLKLLFWEWGRPIPKNTTVATGRNSSNQFENTKHHLFSAHHSLNRLSCVAASRVTDVSTNLPVTKC